MRSVVLVLFVLLSLSRSVFALSYVAEDVENGEATFRVKPLTGFTTEDKLLYHGYKPNRWVENVPSLEEVESGLLSLEAGAMSRNRLRLGTEHAKVSVLYKKMGLFELSMSHDSLAYECFRVVHPTGAWNALANLMEGYFLLGEPHEGRELFARCKAELPDSCDDVRVAYLHQVKAMLAKKKKDFDKAKTYLDSALIINEKNANDAGLVDNYMSMSHTLAVLGDYYGAFYSVEKARKIDAERNGNRYFSGYNSGTEAGYVPVRLPEEKDAFFKSIIVTVSTQREYRFLAKMYVKAFLYFYRRERFREAGPYLKRALELSLASRDYFYATEVLRHHEKLYKTYNDGFRQHLSKLDTVKAFGDSLNIEGYSDSLIQVMAENKFVKPNQRKHVANLGWEGSGYTIPVYVFWLVLAFGAFGLTYFLVRMKRLYQWYEDELEEKGRELKTVKDRLEEGKGHFDDGKEKVALLVAQQKKGKEDLNRLIHLMLEGRNIFRECLKTFEETEDGGEQMSDTVRRHIQVLEQDDVMRYNLDGDNMELKNRIDAMFPQLSKNEKQLCLLVKLKYSMKEIALHNNTSQKSVEVARYRLRKKLGLESNEAFNEMIEEL
ncbi:hypothetical protein FUAX_48290 (plasmid) [Fulvitalea axinellae]|uniref:HTH luxR-type domain-containing protein n=1 Tax=Fulvitalea axinellae TaxID=1182444 RepID=A0AAU9D4F1_9BACT|nr:hypothetical protein FUAX_48290 [Fulvitalea axinellae]